MTEPIGMQTPNYCFYNYRALRFDDISKELHTKLLFIVNYPQTFATFVNMYDVKFKIY